MNYLSWYEAAGHDTEYASRDDTYERWEFADDEQVFCRGCHKRVASRDELDVLSCCDECSDFGKDEEEG